MIVVLAIGDDGKDDEEETADQLGMRPGTLAKVLLHASLAGARTASLGNRARAIAALARLREMAAGLPAVDALVVANEARRELGLSAPAEPSAAGVRVYPGVGALRMTPGSRYRLGELERVMGRGGREPPASAVFGPER